MGGMNLDGTAQVDRPAGGVRDDLERGRANGRFDVNSGKGDPTFPVAAAKEFDLFAEPFAFDARGVPVGDADKFR